MAVHITLLVVFTTAWATLVTVILYVITHNQWVCSFILAGACALFVLENLGLLAEIKQKNEEIEVLQSTQSQKLLKQITFMEIELAQLKKEREQQRLRITNLKLMGRTCKSGSF